MTTIVAGIFATPWKANGGQGVDQGGQTYCSEGCARNTGCTCR